jgi:Predicted esterase of the alpha-beta hydrolase superfamily
MVEEKYNIGLVLSGGGARGFAHLGLIQALNDNGIFPDIISGTSAGAIAGVLYADGHSPKEILKMMNSGSRLDFMRPALPREGLLQFGGIIKILKCSLRAKTFEDLKIPLYVAATDLNNGRAEYFSKGSLIEPVIASASIPVLFQPVLINDVYYVDGGVLDNLPLKPIENSFRYLIGSFVNPVGYMEKCSGLINIAERTFMLSMTKEINEKAKKFDLFVAPHELRNYKILDPEKAKELFEVGYKATMEKLKDAIVKTILDY